MKNFKFTLTMAALVIGTSMAFAFKAPLTHKPLQVEWVRTGNPSNPDGNTWLQQSGGTCDDADLICKADFTSGYNPNTHTYAQNQANATVIEDDGYVQP